MSSSFSLKYKVLEKIGEGSFSEVLKCQNRVTQELVAAKRLKKCYRSRQEVYECPEIIAMRKISRHPNILYIMETHYEHLLGRVTLIFELLDMSIYDFMKTRKRCMPESRVRNYLYQLLQGVCHLHKSGLFHRDIKPENILIKLTNYDPLDQNKGEIIKLGDLGSIRGIFSKPPYTEYISTRWYRSPECLLTNGYYGPKMDVWAVGCVFYEMLTLKPMFPGSDELDQIHKINSVLGTPSSRLLTKFHKHKSRNCSYAFPKLTGTGINNLVPTLSIDGCDILKQMLIYDPDIRSNVRRLLDHKYFKDFRNENDFVRRTLSLSQNNYAKSTKSIGDHSKAKLKETREKTVNKPSKNLPPVHSEIISHMINDSKNALKSKSGSINLDRVLKKPEVKVDSSKLMTISKLNYASTTKKQPLQQTTGKVWDNSAHIAAKLSLLKNSEKINLPSRLKNNVAQTEKLQSNRSSVKRTIAGHEAYMHLIKELKRPVSKRLSDPGSARQPEIPFIGKQFVSKSFILPHKSDGGIKLATISEQQQIKNRLSLMDSCTSHLSKSFETSLPSRPLCRKTDRISKK